ncbi:MAG: hypothetical protein LC804_26130 [Acidobacteria bacterium]|nr:hypothetical protein [Acidobacteriota bacterium]
MLRLLRAPGSAQLPLKAQTLASLNHPHIAHIHGLEESNGVRAIVMELVEGEDLSPLPVSESGMRRHPARLE